MSDGELFCPICGRKVQVVWTGNRLLYRPHNRPAPRDGERCPKSNKAARSR